MAVQPATMSCEESWPGPPPGLEARDPAAWAAFGGELFSRCDLDGAIAAFRVAEGLRPEWPELQLNLGVALKRRGRLEEAAAACRRAAAGKPGWAQPWHNLGSVLQALGRPGEALAAFERAVRLAPDWRDAHNSLGAALDAAGRTGDAEAAYLRAAELDANWHLPWFNLGCLTLRRGDFRSAERLLREAIRHEPSFHASHLTLGLLLLQRGDFAEGWREYEWRWDCEGHTPAQAGHAAPVWDGSPLEGRTILLWTEQGLGDTLQFIRYARLVRERGGMVRVCCPPALAGLLATCPGIDRVIPAGEPLGDFTIQAPLLSLPHILGTSEETIPREVPYLTAPGLTPEALPPPLATAHSALRVGIVWATGAAHSTAAQRSCPVALFRGLADISGAQIFGLQYGEAAGELRDLADPRLVDLSPWLGDFATTAALVEQMDLILTVDTAMAHLAGALGKKVWTLLPQPADWRWLLDREDSPWYPTMRLFRQSRSGDWEGVFGQVARALAAWAQEPPFRNAPTARSNWSDQRTGMFPFVVRRREASL